MKPVLGTFIEITLEGSDQTGLFAASEKAFAEIQQIHDLMSFQEPGSELSRLNREADHRAVRVDPRTFEVLAAAQQLSQETGGVFDVTVAPSLMHWGLLPRHAWDALRHRARNGNWADIDLRPGGLVRFARALRLDLGGIAKGYAVDRAVDILRSQGVAGGIVNAGGDLRVFGASSRPVMVRDPGDPARLHPFGSLYEEAVATSAPYFCRARHAGRRISHLIDPRSGTAQTAAISVSVRAPRCLHADALTKVALLAPEAAVAPLLRRGARALRLSAAPARTSAVA